MLRLRLVVQKIFDVFSATLLNINLRYMWNQIMRSVRRDTDIISMDIGRPTT